MNQFKAYYQRARKRAKRRKSPWNLVLIPLTICGVFGIWGLLAILVLRFQQYWIPQENILAHYTTVGGILMFVPILLPSFTIGMMLANLIAWCIPPARKAFNREARGIPQVSFRNSMTMLAKASGLMLIIVIPLSLFGAMNYFYVTTDGINLNPIFSFEEKNYDWGNIAEIRTRCFAERRNLHLNYIVHMNDGMEIDFLNEPRMKFVNVYDRIKPFVEAQNDIVYKSDISAKGIRRLRARYHARDAERILEILRGE